MSKKISIIGGGPAGISTAIQLQRYGLEPVLFEGDHIGGLLRNAWRVENLPNSPIGLSGAGLIEQFKKNLDYFRINIVSEVVLNLDYQNDKFVITTNDNTFDCDIVVVATGTIPKRHPLEISTQDNIRRKIFYEVSRMPESNDKDILIVGAGDAAFDYALNQSRLNRVTILNRSIIIPALPLLQKLVAENRSIDYWENSKIEHIDLSDDDRLIVSINKAENIETLDVDTLLFAVGRIENKEFYSRELFYKETDLIKKGLLFLAGDVKNGLFRQSSIAIGDGIKSAMEIFLTLRKIDNEYNR